MGSAILPCHDELPVARDPFQPSPRGSTAFYRTRIGTAMVERPAVFACRADRSGNDTTRKRVTPQSRNPAA